MNREAKILLGIGGVVIVVLVVIGILYGNTTPLNLDVTAFTTALDSKAGEDYINQDRADGIALQISGTPTFYMNGVETNSQDLDSAIQAALQI